MTPYALFFYAIAGGALVLCVVVGIVEWIRRMHK